LRKEEEAQLLANKGKPGKKETKAPSVLAQNKP